MNFYRVPHCEKEDIKIEIDLMGMARVTEDEPHASNLMRLNDALDEFFDVPEPSNDERSENEWPLFMSPELCYMVSKLSKLAWIITLPIKSVEADRLHTMFLAMAVVRADRLHNMITSAVKKTRASFEG